MSFECRVLGKPITRFPQRSWRLATLTMWWRGLTKATNRLAMWTWDRLSTEELRVARNNVLYDWTQLRRPGNQAKIGNKLPFSKNQSFFRFEFFYHLHSWTFNGGSASERTTAVHSLRLKPAEFWFVQCSNQLHCMTAPVWWHFWRRMACVAWN